MTQTLHILLRTNSAFGHKQSILRNQSLQFQSLLNARFKGSKVAVVNADHRRSGKFESPLDFFFVVRFDKHVLFNPHINYGYYLSPSFMPMMLMIFVVMVTVFAIGTELKHATAREWLGTGNGSVAAALAGKVLPITAVMFLISLVMLVINFKIVGTPLNGSLAVILAGTLLFILSYQSISVLIVSLLANLRLSLSIGGGYSVLAFTFSGLTFPIMAMWEPMQWVSKIFPFTFYTDIFVDQMLRGTPWVYSLPDLCYMSLFIVLPLLCLPRLKRVCTEEKFWGRL